MSEEDEEHIVVACGGELIATEDDLKIKEEDSHPPYVDPEHLIIEVQARSVLWDLGHEGKDKMKKTEAWSEVCSEVVNEYINASLIRKRIIEKAVAARWKNLKDAYRRFRHDEYRYSGIRHKKRRRYVFADKMKFLDHTLPGRPDTPEVRIRPRQSRRPTESTPESRQQDVDTPKIKMISEPTEEPQCFNVLEYPAPPSLQMQSCLHQVDEHQSFFNSLLSTVRSFNEDEVFEFRMGVMTLAQSIKRRRKE